MLLSIVLLQVLFNINSNVIIISTTVHVPKQVTLAVIKPDAVKAGLVDEIIKKVKMIHIILMFSICLVDYIL